MPRGKWAGRRQLRAITKLVRRLESSSPASSSSAANTSFRSLPSHHHHPRDHRPSWTKSRVDGRTTHRPRPQSERGSARSPVVADHPRRLSLLSLIMPPQRRYSSHLPATRRRARSALKGWTKGLTVRPLSLSLLQALPGRLPASRRHLLRMAPSRAARAATRTMLVAVPCLLRLPTSAARKRAAPAQYKASSSSSLAPRLRPRYPTSAELELV